MFLTKKQKKKFFDCENLFMLSLAFVSNKSPTHEYDYEIYSSNLKEDRVKEAQMSFESNSSF